jgi:hypothetical protein
LRVLDAPAGRLRARAFAGLPREAVAKLENEDVTLDTFLSWLSDEFRVGRSYFISHTTAFSQRLPEGVRPALGARILAAVDALHGHTRGTPHRPSLTAASALEEMERASEVRLDPRVVAAVADLLAEEGAAERPAASGRPREAA